jgi:tetratricopeptide (TPR) repeat protein
MRLILIGLLILTSTALLYASDQSNPPLHDSIKVLIADDDPGTRIRGYLYVIDEHFYSNGELAEKYILEALEIADEYEIWQHQINLNVNLGVINSDRNRFNEARESFMKALKIAEDQKDSTYLASIYGNIGNIEMYEAKYEDAINYFIKTYEIFESQENKIGAAKVLGALGNLNLMLSDIEKAISYYEKSYVQFKELGNGMEMATSLMNLGICYSNQEDYIKAEKNYQLAYESFMASGNKKRAAQCLANRAIVFQRLKKYDEAFAFSKHAHDLFEELGDSLEMASCLKDIGVTRFEQGNYDNAILNYKLSYQILKDNSKYISLETLLEQMIIAYDSLRDYKKAYEFSNHLMVLMDSIYNIETRSKIMELQTKFDVNQKEREIQIQNLLIEKQNQDVEKYKRVRWLLMALMATLILSGVLFFNRIKLKQKNKEEHLKRKNLEIEQQLLRSQMNPHFIFNSLNSIQGFISSNDTYQAEKYLSKFATLVRSIMENSRKSKVTLREDLEILTLYIELESMRFNEKFDIQFNLAEEIDDSMIMIPPLMFQPFVENSIKHGLTGLSGRKGSIKITFEEEEDILVCSIKDNGIGRKKAEKMKDSGDGHISLGLKVTSERLKLLGQKFKRLTSIQIIDLYNEVKEPAGTQVVIRIPV